MFGFSVARPKREDLEAEIARLQIQNDNLRAFNRQWKEQAMSRVAALIEMGGLRNKIGDMENVIDRQNRDLEHARNAIADTMGRLEAASIARATAEGKNADYLLRIEQLERAVQADINARSKQRPRPRIKKRTRQQ